MIYGNQKKPDLSTIFVNTACAIVDELQKQWSGQKSAPLRDAKRKMIDAAPTCTKSAQVSKKHPEQTWLMRDDDYKKKLFGWLLYFHDECKSDTPEERRLLKEFAAFKESIDLSCNLTLANPLIHWIHKKFSLQNADQNTQAIAELQTKTYVHGLEIKAQHKVNSEQAEQNSKQDEKNSKQDELNATIQTQLTAVASFLSSTIGSTHLSAL